DHYMGIGTLMERFPDTPIYMTAAAIEEFKHESGRVVDWMKKNMPAEAPNALPTPEALPTSHFLVDGQAIEIMQGQGDESKTTNSFVWIPALRAAVAGDMVFNQVHVWLFNSNEQSRAAWVKSLETLAALRPSIVVAGPKKSVDLKDTPDAIAFTAKYIQDFETARKTSSNIDGLIAAMKAKYPDLGLSDKILPASARGAFRKTD